MYHLKSYYEYNAPVATPSCMYSMPSYYSDTATSKLPVRESRIERPCIGNGPGSRTI